MESNFTHVTRDSSRGIEILIVDVLTKIKPTDLISSLSSGGFADATADMCWFGVWWGHGIDVPRTGCARLGSGTRHVSFYVSLVGGGLRLSTLIREQR